MSDANRTKIGMVKEAVFGTTPATPAIKNLRVKGSGLSFTPKTVESKELRADRMVADLPRVANEAGGTLPLEVSWRSLDDLHEYVMQNNWVRTPVRDNNGIAASNITAVSNATGIFTCAAVTNPTTDFSSGASFAIGMLIRTSGFTNAANNGLFRVTTAGASPTVSPTTTVTDAAPVAAARMKVIGFRGVATDITATATGLASTLLDFTTLGLQQGQWLKIGGNTGGEKFAITPANNAWVRVNGAVTATAIPLDNLPAGWGVDAGTGQTLTVQYGDVLKNGTVEQTMSIEQQYQDLLVPEYDYYTGMALDQLALGFKQQDLIDATATFVGANASNSTARIAGATDIAAPTNDVINTSSNLASITENGAVLPNVSAITAVNLTISNSIRRRPALGNLGSIDIASGTFRVKGDFTMYYGSNVVRTKVLAGTASNFVMRTVDTTAPNGSRAYVFDIPKMKYEDGNPAVPGIDTDRTMQPKFTAIAHPTLGYEFSIQRVEEYF